MHAKSTHEQVDSQADAETREQQLPARHVDGHQHHKDEIDIRMHIAAHTDVVDDQHLRNHQHHETDYIQQGLVHSLL